MKPDPEDSDDALWNLLHVLPPPSVNPRFTQDVLRQVRLLPKKLSWREAVLAWFLSVFSLPAKRAYALAFILLLSGLIIWGTLSRDGRSNSGNIEPALAAQTVPSAQAPPSVEEEPLDEQITKDYYRLEVVEQLLARQDVTEFADEELEALLY